MVERGPYVSYANCGLPYHVGGVIKKEASLLVATREMFRERSPSMCARAARRSRSRRRRRRSELATCATGEVTTRPTTSWCCRPGPLGPSAAARHRPSGHLPGPDRARRAGRSASGSRRDRSSPASQISGIQTAKPRAVVVGGGFIGLEMAENLVHRGFEVTVVEMLDQVLAPLDRGIRPRSSRATLRSTASSSRSTTAWPRSSRPRAARSRCTRNPARPIRRDLVILALGVRPDTALAKTAGLEIGARGGIRVDDQMRTSDPDIFAVGDAIEVKDFVTGEWSLIALAGPANRQGRIAADVIAGPRLPFPWHAGHLDHRPVRRGHGLDRRQREDAQAAGRQGLRENLHLPEFPRGLLSRREADRA